MPPALATCWQRAHQRRPLAPRSHLPRVVPHLCLVRSVVHAERRAEQGLPNMGGRHYIYIYILRAEGGSGTLTAAYGHIQTAVPTIGHENRHIGHEIQNPRSTATSATPSPCKPSHGSTGLRRSTRRSASTVSIRTCERTCGTVKGSSRRPARQTLTERAASPRLASGWPARLCWNSAIAAQRGARSCGSRSQASGRACGSMAQSALACGCGWVAWPTTRVYLVGRTNGTALQERSKSACPYPHTALRIPSTSAQSS